MAFQVLFMSNNLVKDWGEFGKLVCKHGTQFELVCTNMVPSSVYIIFWGCQSTMCIEKMMIIHFSIFHICLKCRGVKSRNYCTLILDHLYSICTLILDHLYSICTLILDHLYSICTLILDHLYSICTLILRESHAVIFRDRVVPASQVPFPGEPSGELSGEPGNGTWRAGTTLYRRNDSVGFFFSPVTIKLLQRIRTKTSFDQFCIRFIRIYHLLWSSARVRNELLTNHRRDIKTQGEGRWTRQGWIYPMFDVIRYIFTIPLQNQRNSKGENRSSVLYLCSIVCIINIQAQLLYLTKPKIAKIQSWSENSFKRTFLSSSPHLHQWLFHKHTVL